MGVYSSPWDLARLPKSWPLEVPLWALLQLAHLPLHRLNEFSSCTLTHASGTSTAKIEGKQAEEERPPCVHMGPGVAWAYFITFL